MDIVNGVSRSHKTANTFFHFHISFSERVRSERIHVSFCRKPSQSGQRASLVTFKFPVFYERNCQRKSSEERRSRNSIKQCSNFVG